ncbi:MAG: hypothetical protein Q9184_007395 [Pyrenodesmia sp. 2 TL-2023]
MNGDAASKAQVDPTYGQRSAFPGLDDTAEEDTLFYGPASDGLEYLRMVRSEAKGVPNLLTAAKPHTSAEHENPYQDYPQGYYHDGAYVATTFALAARNTYVDAETGIDPQEAYYTSLLTHFHALSFHLRSSSPASPPDASAIATASDLNTAPLKKWRTTLLYTQPTTALLSHLAQEATINGISALERFLDWRMLERGYYLGAWAWGLLARCRGVGMMGSEEVGVLRDLGKKARGMIRGMRAGLGLLEEAEKRDEGEEGEGVGDGDGDDSRPEGNDVKDAPVVEDDVVFLENPLDGAGEDDVAVAKHRLLATLQQDTPSEPPDPLSQPTPKNESPGPPHTKDAGPAPAPAASASTPPTGEVSSDPVVVAPTAIPGENEEIPLTNRISATLDMIVTIVGEEYGQRDLLHGRMIWE